MTTSMTLTYQCACKLAAFKSKARPSARRMTTYATSCTNKQPNASRRAALASLLTLPLLASPALALIPDDDDEELLELAKKNRAERMKEQKAVEKDYAKSSGFRDFDQDRLQKAVTSLARVGSQLSAGDVGAASSTLSGTWLEEATSAAKEFGDFSGVASAIAATRSAAGSGDLAAAKTKFVSAVSAFQSWASSAGIAGQLRGI